MNVLHVVPYYAPAYGFGGPVQSSLRVAKALQDEGHAVNVLATDVSGSSDRLPSGWTNEEGVPLYRAPNMNHDLARGGKIFLPMTTPKRLADRIELSRFDIVHMQEYRNVLNLLVASACKKEKVPYVLSPRGTLPQEHGKSFLKKGFDRLAGRRLLHDASLCIALTPRERDQLTSFGVPEDRIRMVPNAVPETKIPGDPDGFLREHGIPRDAHRVLFLSRLHPVKGLERAIQAVHQMGCEDVHLVIVGPEEGIDVDGLLDEYEMNGAATYCGPLYGTEKADAYEASDVYALPSRMEGLPNTILEAMAAGLPIVASKECNMGAWIDGRCGFETTDQEAFRSALKRLATNPSLQEEMGSRAQELAQKHFSQDRILERTAEVYREAATSLA